MASTAGRNSGTKRKEGIRRAPDDHSQLQQGEGGEKVEEKHVAPGSVKENTVEPVEEHTTSKVPPPGNPTETASNAPSENAPGIFSDINNALFGDPWEMWIGAIFISILSILLFIIESPLGSIGGINNYGQNIYNSFGLSLDSAATDGVACPGDFLYAMLVLSVFLGAAVASLFAKEFAIRIAPKPELGKGLVGGLLMGIGGSIGMGCTISGFYSSLPALSGGGLFFGFGLFIGVYIALKYLLWESGRFPSLTEGKWIRYLEEEKGKPSWQPFAGFFVLMWGTLLITIYNPFSPSDRDLKFIGFILIGLLVGFFLQRSRFCIFRAIREPFLSGDPRPAQAIISGLLVGLVGFTVIKGVGQGDEYSFIFANYWLPGLVGGTIFGMGMTSAGGCSIGSTWRAAEGNVKHLLAVIGIAISMPLTGEYFTPRFLDTIPASAQQMEFLPDTIGYGGAVLLILFLLFLWYVILKWNERDGILLLIGGPDSDEPYPWPARKDLLLAGFIAFLLLSGTAIFAVQHTYWSDDDDELSVEEIFQNRIEEFLFSGRPSSFTAPEVAALLTDGYSGNDPHIISVRNQSMYELGHIPTAQNVPAEDIFSESHFESLPRNRLIIVYDDTGHLSAEIASLMNVMGLFAVSLEWGMASWTANATIAPGITSSFQQMLNNYTITTGNEPGVFTRSSFMQNVGQCGFVTPPPPDVDEDVEETLRKAIHSMIRSRTASSSGSSAPSSTFSSSPSSNSPLTISSTDLEQSLTSSTPLNDPFVLDIRSPPRYQKGHIPGAINTDIQTMFWNREFDILPEEGRTIVVIGDTPHHTSQATAFLNAIGYPTTALEYGMASWTNDPDVPTVTLDRTTDVHNFPVSSGPTQGAYESAEVMGLTEEELLLMAAVSLREMDMEPINATLAFSLLQSPDQSDDPFVIGIQDTDDPVVITTSAQSMITSLEDLFSRESLRSLSRANMPLLVYDSYGQEAPTAAAFLNLLGFNATYLQHGLCAWTNNTEAIPQPLNYSTLDILPVDTSIRISPAVVIPLTPHPGLLWTEPDVLSREWDILRQTFQDFFTHSPQAGSIFTRDALSYDISDGLSENDPIITSIRSAIRDNSGRIPGSNKSDVAHVLDVLFSSNSISPKPWVIISQDGEEASIVSAMLRLNGIDSSYLQFGFDSWQYNETISKNPCVDPAARVNAFPLL
jgi:uncharacterized protein